MFQIEGTTPEMPADGPQGDGSQPDLSKEGIRPADETPIELTPQQQLAMRRDALEAHVNGSGIAAQEAIEWADLDGCLTTDNPAVWSLINAHFASGAGYADGMPREVVPVGIPGQFSLDSVCKAIAGRLGQSPDSDESPQQYIRTHLEGMLSEREQPARGTEAIHIAIQLEPVEKLLALSLRLPENMRELDRRIWEPVEKARGEYKQAISDLSDFLDQLNEDYLATFSLCLPKPAELIGDSIRDTIWR